MSLGSTYWAGRFATWPAPTPSTPGYSLLMPVPGDLPVFLELALAVAATQNATHRVETIVTPDQPTKQVVEAIEARRDGWQGDLRLELLPRPERELLPRLGNPGHNHGVQLITGVTAASGSHIILHDADLFLLEHDALEKHYAATVEGNFAVSGVSPVWDPWFAEQGVDLVATWELCARRDWLRSFPPHMHMGHVAELREQQHVFDTTLHPQSVTDPRLVALRDQGDSIVHFNYVISTYRHYQKARDGFVDSQFRILLIRLFVDLFAEVEAKYDLPSLTELKSGIGGSGEKVCYPAPSPETVTTYQDFRAKVQKILNGPWTSPERSRAAAKALSHFDTYYDRAH